MVLSKQKDRDMDEKNLKKNIIAREGLSTAEAARLAAEGKSNKIKDIISD